MKAAIGLGISIFLQFLCLLDYEHHSTGALKMLAGKSPALLHFHGIKQAGDIFG
jgi:hypothetical protein